MSKLDDEISERVKKMKPEHKRAYATKKIDTTLYRKIVVSEDSVRIIPPFEALGGSMGNGMAYRLGQIAVKVGTQTKGVGDEIDRGLILVEELRKNGFHVLYVGKKPL